MSKMTRNRDTDQESDLTRDHPFAIKQVDNGIESQANSTEPESNEIESQDKTGQNNKKGSETKDQKYSAKRATQSQSDRKLDRQTPLNIFRSNYINGGKIGSIVYVAGVLITYIFTFVLNDISDAIGPYEANSNLKWAGQLYHSSHNIKIAVLDQGGGLGSGYIEINAIEISSSVLQTIPKALYMLLPVILLIIGGYVLYQNSGHKNLPMKKAAAMGASITFGYVIFGILGRYLYLIRIEEGEVIYHPELAGSVLIVGLLYPVIFGGIGGIISASRE